jgi:tagatose 6-phosphate kinase
MILIVGQNLAWQKICFIPALLEGKPNEIAEVHAFGSSKGPNVARALCAQGTSSETIGYCGGFAGRLAEDDLKNEGIQCTFVPLGDETRTCSSYIEPDGTCTEVIEPSPAASAAERQVMRDRCADGLRRAGLLVIAGTAVGDETDDCYRLLVRSAHEKNLPVILDASSSQAREALKESPEVLKINTMELAQLSGRSTGTVDERVAVYESMAREFGIRWFFVTRGSQGMEAYGAGTLLRSSPPPVRVINPIGSGDAATAGVASLLHEAFATGMGDRVFGSGDPLREALRSATAMGTANCLNWKNGKVVRDDYLALKPLITVT